MLSNVLAFVFDDDDDDFADNVQPMPTRQTLLAAAYSNEEIESTDEIESADETESADEINDDEPLERVEPLESNIVFMGKDGPWTFSSRHSTLAAVPAIDIDDENGVAFEDTVPSPVTSILSTAASADDVDDQSTFIIEDEEDVGDDVISFDTADADDAVDQDTVEQEEIVLTSSGCSLKPHRRNASSSSKEAAGPLEIRLTDTACKLKKTSSNVVTLGATEAFPADMLLSIETPGRDLEESLYFTIGDMIIPSFFAGAAGHTVKTHTVSYEEVPSSWEASIDEIGTAFEKSSALLAYLANHSDETVMNEAFKTMPEQQSEFFVEEIKSAQAKGYSLFAHSDSLDGLFSVAVPVFADNEVIGAIGIFIPRALTFGDNLEKHILPQLRLMASDIAQSHDVASVDVETADNVTSIAMAA